MKSIEASRLKSSLSLLPILSLVLVLVFAGQPYADVYVDDDGTYDAATSSCNGLDTCFTSIQSAIAAASTGEDVVVCPGTYNESILMESGIDVVSKDGHAVTTIAPLITSGTSVVSFDGDSNCTLDGFHIDASTAGTQFAFGVVFVDGKDGTPCTNVTIKDCDIYGQVGMVHGGPSSGIQLEGEVSVSITGNIIRHNSYAGISSKRMGGEGVEGGPVTIKGNTIGIEGEANGGAGIFLTGAGTGVEVRIGGDLVTDSNTISYTGPSAFGPGGVGVRLENISDVSVENNDIFNNATAGILLNDVTTVVPHIRNNDIYDHNAGVGINIGGASNVTIGDDNLIHDNLAGIAFHVSNNPDISPPDLTPSSQPVTIRGNNFDKNTKAGIAVIDHVTGTITIDGNKLEQNSRSGIAFFNACTAVITDNEVLKHISNGGIYTGQWSPPYPQGGDGFDRNNGPANLTIKRNKVYRNRSGMRLDHASGTISNNLVYDNSRAGIRFSGDNIEPYEVFLGSWGITEIKNNTVVANGGTKMGDDIGGGIVYDAFYEASGDFEDHPIGATQNPITIKNNILANNVKAGIKFCADNSGDARSYNLFYRNVKGTCDTGGGVDCGRMCRSKTLGRCDAPDVNCCDQDSWADFDPADFPGDWATGEICGQDPLFNGDYTLNASSPAKGTGDCSGSPCDMGAYGGTDPITW